MLPLFSWFRGFPPISAVDFRVGQSRSLWLLLLLLGTSVAWAQAPASRQLAPDGTPQFIRLARAAPGPVSGPVAAPDPLPVLRRELALLPNDELRPLRTETDELGFTHVRYQQYYRGVKVEHGVYSAHSRNGQVETLSGELKRPAGLAVQPALNAAAARRRALAAVGATRYMWQNPAEEAGLKQQQNDPTATYFPTGELVLVEDYRQPAATRTLVLAWKFDIYAQTPISRAYYYIDARTGKVVLVDAIIKHANGLSGPLSGGAAGRRASAPASTRRVAANATGTFATRYSGAQTAGTESITGGYRLHDPSRGNGVNTYNALKNNSYSGASEFTDADNNWTAAEYNNANYDNAALDAHWGAQGVYDYWLNVHARNSFNGSGAAINSYVHFDNTPGDGKGYDNAFWNGLVMTYGDGDVAFTPLTSLDVCSHEIGHAVCSYTANLVYANESGGLNEGFSDIWGACVEYYRAPTKQTWLIGEDIVSATYASYGYNCLRSMSNPASSTAISQCPSYYGGTRWVAPVATPTGGAGGNDYGGVHTNSGVLNYWFYLVSQGSASGTNDGHAFNAIIGTGINKAAKIAYRAENIYLTSNSNFAAARTATLQAAADLYGVPERTAVAQAWFAVGLGEPAPTLTSFVQTSGPVGEPVTLTGTNFMTAFSVRFNGVEASSFTVNSATSITAIVPGGATSGTLAVQTPSGTAISAGSFTLTVRPTITAINPASAAAGASIVISGTNFAGASAVTFFSNAVVPAGSFTLNTGVNPNTITVVVPGAAATGPVTVTTNAASAGFAFTVTSFAVVARDPVRQARQAPVAGPVNLTFSQAPGASTGAGTPIGIFSSQRGGRRNGSGTFSSAGNRVTYTPSTGTPFQPGEVVSVTTTSAAASTGGTALVPETYQFTVAAGQATATLGTATATTVGTRPRNVAIGDVNGDGFPDAVVANTNEGTGTTVSVRLGNGAGGFSGTTDLTVGTGPQTVVLADVNNDGRLDIAVACPNSSAIYILVRNATGSAAGDFAAATSVSTTVAAVGLAVADFNNDGWLDLATANIYNNVARVGISLNAKTATGTFAASAIITDLLGGNCGGVAAADMNNDGKMDLLVTNTNASGNSYPNTVTMATGDGAGGFTAQTNGPMGTDPRTLAVGDLNNDGKPDFVTANQSGGNVSVRLGDGAGGFTVPATSEVTVGANQQPQQVALADMNGDGNLDLVATNYFANPGKVSIRLGAGNGSFSVPATPEYNAGSQCWGLAVADVNSDGALDVVTSDWGTTTMSVLLNTPIPVVASISPTSGVPGTSVTIFGSGFIAGSTATIGGVALGSPVVNIANQTVTGTVGANSPLGDQAVVVANGARTSNATVLFTVLAPVPTIASFTPTSGFVGTSVVITGTGFTGTTNATFNVTPAASFVVNSSTQLTAVVAVGTTSGLVRVTTPGGTAFSTGNFTVIPPLSISSFTLTGTVGSTVTIDGAGFTGLTAVRFGEVPALFTVVSDTRVTTTVPRLASTNKLRLTGPAGTAATASTYGVTRRGSSLVYTSVSGSSLNTLRVGASSTGTVSAPTFTDLDGDGILDLVVGEDSGVLNHYAQSTAASNTFSRVSGSGLNSLNAPYDAAPVFTDLDGNGLLDMVVSLDNNGGGGILKHYEQSAPASTTFTANSTTFSGIAVATYSTPIITDLDGNGLLDLLVINTSRAVVRYEQTGPNLLTFAAATNPTGLPTSGNYALALADIDGNNLLDLVTSNGSTLTHYEQTGAGLLSFAAVTSSPLNSLALGSQPNPVFTDVDGNGLLDLVVGNVNGTFTHLEQAAPPLPALSSVSPAAELPGQVVTLTGGNFTSGSTVSFGGVAAAGVTYVSASSLTVIVPVGAGATVSVTTPAGTSPTNAFTLLAVADATTLAVNTCTTATPATNAADSNWHYLLVGGQVVLAYNTQGRNLGTVSAELLRADPATAVRQDERNHAYLGRNWHLTTSAGTFVGYSVLVRFYGLTSEFAQLQAAAPTVVTSLAALRITQYSGTNEDCQLNNNGAAGQRRLLTPTSTSGPSNSNFFVSEALVADHFSEFYLNGGTTPLPVELTAFTATLAVGPATRLAWTTASEQNSARFEVERSPNGTFFDRIGTVVAAGSSSAPRSYAFTDSKLPNNTVLLYYRLLQVDQDGSFSYSPVRNVAVSGPLVQAWTLVPNPGRVTTLTGAQAGASVLVFDVLGRLVLTATADAAGSAELVLPATLHAGVYLVRSGSQATRLAVE